MNLAILHLSDAHFYNYEQLDDIKIDGISKALKELEPFDELIICFTGDVAFSGIEAQYKIAGSFFYKLFENIRKKYKSIGFIKCCIAPGNHDIYYNKESRNRTEIIKSMKNVELAIKQEHCLMNDFYNFARKHDCFKNPSILESIDLRIDDKTVRINIINSALFSDLWGDDKGIHYIPDYLINNLTCDAELSVSLMHHTLGWLNEGCQNTVKRALYQGTSVLLLGHEHCSNGEVSKINKEYKMITLNGGMLCNKGNYDESIFNGLNINLKTKDVLGYSFEWDNKVKVYSPKEIIKEKYQNKSLDRMEINDDFKKELLKDERNHLSKSFLDYYVFPSFEKCNQDAFLADEFIDNYDDFIKFIEEEKVVLIEGKDNMGKSLLAKYLFINLSKTRTPILINSENINGSSVEKIVKRVFEDQYSEENVIYDKYKQLELNQKVAIFDDFHKINSKLSNKIIENLIESCGYIILLTEDKFDFDIVKKVKEKQHISVDRIEQLSKLQIEPLHLKKRKELISNVCSLNSFEDKAELLKKEKQIENFINIQLRLFESTPDFLIKYINYVLSMQSTTKNNNQSIFSEVYRANITNSINNGKVSANSVDEVLMVLDEIAYYIHFKKRYPLSYSEYQEIIDNYNRDYDMKVDSRKVYECILESKIVKTIKIDASSDNIVFSSNNYLAFFVARRVNRKCLEELDLTDIKYILHNICFGINSDILLFISSQTENINILKLIYTEAENIIKDWSEFSTDKDKCLFLDKVEIPDSLIVPTVEEKSEIEAKQIENERKFRHDDIVNVEELYDYDESKVNDYFNLITRSFKLTKMIARIIPNFNHRLKSNDKKSFVSAVYNYPNKIVNQMLLPIFENMDSIIQEILESIEESSQNNLEITEKNIRTDLEQISVAVILSIYDIMAIAAISEKTIDLFDLKNLQETVENTNTHKIQRLIMLENGNKLDTFINEAEKICKDSKIPLEKLMIKKIVRKVLLTHENISKNNQDRLIGRFFPNQKKIILLEQAKQRT
ncbi:metallophosphoesterase [Acetobacterium wieringae]|uniref:metallophosphoesterase n=1 Tax=Acetobacterium wieringae TaxID=52694 RepID=UPI003158B60C